MDRKFYTIQDKIFALVLIYSLTFGASFRRLALADDAASSVSVPNTVPAFTANIPYEDPASYATTPTNVGSNVVFKATATDLNSDQWKLLVCQSAGTTGIACTGDTWCNSTSAVNSGVENSCSYTALVGDAQSNNWWGYACDATGCSTVSQGSGDSGSPFKVNHRPAFTVYADDGPKGPATTITWTSTASDPDNDTTPDTVSLYVCKENDFTGTDCGIGGAWCSDTGKSSNPTCNTTTLRPDGDYTAYGFVIDNHNFIATGGAEGTDSSPTVTNSTPSITALLNEEAATPNFKVTFVVTDANSCKTIASGDEIASAFLNLRMSEKISTACDGSGEYNANDCYPDADATWNPTCAQDLAVNPCTDNTDTDVGWSCTFPIQYHADSTVTGTPKAAYTWIAAVQATDDDSANTGLVDSTTGSNEMDKFLGYNLTTATIAYGSVAATADSVEQTTTVEATGNIGLDQNLSGSKLCNDYPTCAGTDDIAISQQHYNLTAVQGWAAGTALSGTAANTELNCAKTTVTLSPATASTYWVLQVPSGQAVDTYTGENAIEGTTDNETYG
ncbi:MAG: hypothetical protein NTX26_03160 [Candidatus Parcubacteria bacterium]|nr:hypothetical protein [Candidatus Parcubacteria bacterium]